jgi:hypothetical protein
MLYRSGYCESLGIEPIRDGLESSGEAHRPVKQSDSNGMSTMEKKASKRYLLLAFLLFAKVMAGSLRCYMRVA